MIIFLCRSCSRANGDVHEDPMVHCRQYFVPQGLKKFENYLYKHRFFYGGVATC